MGQLFDGKKLKSELLQVRRRPKNFLFAGEAGGGKKDFLLITRKKTKTLVEPAKKESKQPKAVWGRVSFEGRVLRFECGNKMLSRLDKRLKALVKEAGQNLKVEAVQAQGLVQEEYTEEDESGGEQQTETVERTKQEKAAAVKLVTAMKREQKKLAAAIATSPPERQKELKGKLSEFKEAIRDNRPDDANRALRELRTRLEGEFVTNGVDARAALQTPAAQNLIAQLAAADPTAKPNTLKARAAGLLESGSEVAVERKTAKGEKLYKLMPPGDTPSAYTPFWMTNSDLESERATTRREGGVEDRMGLPIGSVSITDVYDVWMIEPLDGKLPVVFDSKIAPTEQGSVAFDGGSSQTLVPNRQLWKDAVKVGTFP